MRLFRIAALSLSAAVVAAAAAHAADAPAVPAAGAPAPAFSLTSNEGKPVSLADYKGKWVVLYFYPKDFTSGCTLEAHNFQRDLARYEADNAVILGVSIDDSLMVASEKTMLEDLIAAALNDARGKADQAAAAEMQKMSSGLPLPPGFKMPF